MGHAAVTTPTAHHVAERLARGGVGQAGVSLEQGFQAWIDDWQMQSSAGLGEDALARLTLSARGADFGYVLDLAADGPLVAQGDGGYSVKSAGGQASHYYSQPFYTATGRLDLPDGPVPVTGQAWLDREWSSQPLGADQTGWDWFSLSFQDGAKLMGFVLRDGGAGFSSGTWIDADGTPHPLEPGALRAEPRRDERGDQRLEAPEVLRVPRQQHLGHEERARLRDDGTRREPPHLGLQPRRLGHLAAQRRQLGAQVHRQHTRRIDLEELRPGLDEAQLLVDEGPLAAPVMAQRDEEARDRRVAVRRRGDVAQPPQRRVEVAQLEEVQRALDLVLEPGAPPAAIEQRPHQGGGDAAEQRGERHRSSV